MVLDNESELIVSVSDTCVHIANSYMAVSDKYKMEILDNLFKNHPEIGRYGRTKKDMFYEWKAHNALYARNYKPERTAHVDFELKQNIFVKFGFWLIAHILKENRQLKYTVKKVDDEYVATSCKYPAVIGVGDTEREAIKEMKIFERQYYSYMRSIRND